MAEISVLIVEDDPDIVELLEYNLEREGLRVLSESDGAKAFDLALEKQPKVILLDLMLPNTNGLDICRKLQQNEATNSIPIIMVTAKGEESDVILGLELGADDYVSKPFSPKELIARIRSVLRRQVKTTQTEVKERIQVGDLEIDSRRYEVSVSGENINLTKSEFSLLKALASYPGQVFTRDQLLDKITGGESIVIDRNVDVHIGVLRKKLGKEGTQIRTVRGVGYKFHESA